MELNTSVTVQMYLVAEDTFYTSLNIGGILFRTLCGLVNLSVCLSVCPSIHLFIGSWPSNFIGALVLGITVLEHRISGWKVPI